MIARKFRVGIDQIAERMSLPAINALVNPVELGDMIHGLVGKPSS